MRSHGSGAGCYCDCGPADAAHAADGAHAADAAYETDGAYAAYETDGADAAYETDGAYAADAAHETDGAYATDAAHGTDETHGTYEAHAFCSVQASPASRQGRQQRLQHWRTMPGTRRFQHERCGRLLPSRLPQQLLDELVSSERCDDCDLRLLGC